MRILKATKDGNEFYFLEYSKESIPEILKLRKSTIGDYYSDGEDLYHYTTDSYDENVLDLVEEWSLIPVGEEIMIEDHSVGSEKRRYYCDYPIHCTVLIKGNYDVEEVKEFK